MNGQTAHKVGCPLITPGIYGRFPRCTCGDAPTEMASLTQIKSRLAAIENLLENRYGREMDVLLTELSHNQSLLLQGQGVLCERLDALAAIIQNGQMQAHQQMEACMAKLDSLQAAKRPKRRRK